MENRSGQISVEFMLLVGLVLIIFIPAFILISRAAFDSADRISGENVGILARTLLDEARETYYLGSGSRQTITIDIPEGIESIMVVNSSGGPENTYELAIRFTQADVTSLTAQTSEVPIKLAEGQDSACSEVSCTGASCECRAIEIEYARSGRRNIELETVSGGSDNYVEIGIVG